MKLLAAIGIALAFAVGIVALGGFILFWIVALAFVLILALALAFIEVVTAQLARLAS